MEIYFVRHGQTAANRGHKHQPTETPLTPKGRQQGVVVADKLAQLKPTHIVSSTYVRALETASLTAAKTNLIPSTSPLYAELLRPQSMYGHGHFSLRSLLYMALWFIERKHYRSVEQGESYLSFIQRMQEAKKMLEVFPSDARIVVFSHSLFINCFIAHLCRKRPLPWWRAPGLLRRIKQLDNSSVSHLRYQADAAGCGWEVVRFDDDAHIMA